MDNLRPFLLQINGEATQVDAAPETPLLYVLRDQLGLMGTRFGCGQGTCGACMVIVDGKAVTACDLTVEALEGARIETIESLGRDGAAFHPLAQAVLDEQAAQCGYCLPGILISAKALLDANPTPNDAEIRAALDGNLCRCGAHLRILRAISAVVAKAST